MTTLELGTNQNWSTPLGPGAVFAESHKGWEHPGVEMLTLDNCQAREAVAGERDVLEQFSQVWFNHV